MRPPRAPDRSGYLAADTIAALASAAGGPIAILRVSGPSALEAAGRMMDPSAPASWPVARMRRVRLRAFDGARIDDAMAAVFRAPKSYTGEDMVELHVHGNPLIIRRALETLVSLGARPALPGEFSFRAVRNGKLTLSEAQAVSEIITAPNDGALELALEKAEGAQSRLVGALAEDLRSLAAYGEVGIDFSDQDVDEVSLPVLKKRLDAITKRLGDLASSVDRGIRIQEGLSVALVGEPNAGKSSLFNALLGEERSIVTDVPGTTRDVVSERLSLKTQQGSATFRLADTAGLRETSDRVEKIGVERTREAARSADLVLWVVEAANAPEATKQWAGLGLDPSRVIGVLTKWDLLSEAERAACLKQAKGTPVVRWLATSTREGEGIGPLADAMVTHAQTLVRRRPGEVVLTRLEHAEAVQRALSDLERAAEAPELDLFAADIRQALGAMEPLIGATVPDDILGKIFAEFCIGK